MRDKKRTKKKNDNKTNEKSVIPKRRIKKENNNKTNEKSVFALNEKRIDY
jgi:hypothetical protein